MMTIQRGAIVLALPDRVVTCGLLSPELHRLAPLVTSEELLSVLGGIALEDLPAAALLRTGLIERPTNGRMVRP